VTDVLAHLPPIPTAKSARGLVFVSVPGEDPETVYNTPNSLMTVFPGEEHGLHSPAETLAILDNTLRNHRNEGGNELVFLNLQRARLGRLDLEKFKRQVNYCLMPNGTATDLALQSLGRYGDDKGFDFMARMGVWFENFALPVVINECLLQSYTGELRLFPNWPPDKDAHFHQLRAVGAFLVSAFHSEGRVQWVDILSEAGKELVLQNPWPAAHSNGQTWTERVIRIPTTQGQILRFKADRVPIG
jgi:alpha-L-fucosidase 2